MAQGWYVVLCKHSLHEREEHVAARIAAQGFPAKLPTVQRKVTRNGKPETETVARYPRTVFARFDPKTEPWGGLCNTRGVSRVLCNPDGIPTPLCAPVPDEVMDVIASYQPTLIEDDGDGHAFKPGDAVTVYLEPGVGIPGVFVEFGKRGAEVEVWMFGRQITTSVAIGALEPAYAPAKREGAA